jgi:arylsulfatase A-like enzyme
MPAPSFRPRLLVALGLAPLLAAFPIYRLAIQIHKQLALPRFLGLLEVAALALAALALVAACMPIAPRAARWLRPALFAGVMANVALVGLAVNLNDPARTPPALGLGLAIALVAITAAFARKPGAEQAQSLHALSLFGRVPMALLALALPYVIAKALADQPRNPASPLPPAEVSLRPDAPKRIVLVTFDELRRRSTTLADPGRDTTPALAALADESDRFTNCHAAGDQTIVSMPTVLTGLRPPTLFGRIHNGMARIREGSVSGIADYMRAAGYHTAYSTMLVQPSSFGLGAGFDEGWSAAVFVDSPFNGRAFIPVGDVARTFVPQRFKPHRVSSMPFDVHPIYSVVEQALAQYREPAGRSFLWVHMGLPHHPYYRIPKSDLKKVIRPTDYRRVHPFLNGHLDDPGFYEAIYDDYTRFSDARLGDLLAGMRASPEWKDTLLIVTSDHGTRLVPTLPGPYAVGEAPEDITHVPLLIHRPGQHASKRVDVATRHEDIVPTILSQVYRDVPAGFQGASLLGAPLPTDRIGYTWAVPPSHDSGPGDRRAIVAYQGYLKLVEDYPAGTARLVDWRRDPEGRHDLSAAHPLVATRLKAWLASELATRE